MQLAPSVLRRFVYQVHKLIQFRRDDYLRAAVALLAHLAVIVGQRIVFAPSASGQTLRVDPIIVLQVLHDA